MPRNNKIASCDIACVPAQWIKLSWFPWGSEKGWETHTHTHRALSLYDTKSHADRHPCCIITHTYILPHSDGCGSSQSFLHPPWAVIQSQGPAQPRPPHRICAQDTGLTQRTHRGSIILITWLKMCKMTAFNDVLQAVVLCVCQLKRDFRSWYLTVQSWGCLILVEHVYLCVQLLPYFHIFTCTVTIQG